MRNFFKARSFAFDMMLAFGLILGMCATAGWMVSSMTNRLVSDARDAVWEAAVPPTYVHDLIDAQWRSHFDIAGAIGDRIALDKARQTIADRQKKVEPNWATLVQLSVDFPQDIRKAIENTQKALNGVREAMNATLEGKQDQQDLLMRQGKQVQQLADVSKTMLQLMQSRIQFVSERAEMTARDALFKFLIIGILIATALIGAFAVLYSRIVKPVSRLSAIMTALRKGQRNVIIPATRRNDEVGRLTEAVRAFDQSLVETEKQRAARENEREAVERARKDDFARLAKNFELHVGKVVSSVTHAVKDLQKSAEAMSRETGSATGRATAVAAASEEATENVRAVAQAANELSNSMNDVGARVASSGEQMREVVAQAERANADMESLGNAADSIGDVARMIRAIASQTNLLALNATIEAARAGEAGRGFAVVAQEVKELASQTSRATEEIAGQIGAIQAASTNAIETIRSMTATLSEVAASSENVGIAIREQIATTGIIADNVGEAARGTVDVTRNISDVTIAIRNSGELVSEVLTSVRELGSNGQALNEEVDVFLRSIQAA